MNTSDSFESPGHAEPLLTATAFVTGTPVAPPLVGHGREPRGETSVQLRGTRRGQSMIPRSGDGIRSRVRLPEPRKDGAKVYLKQLVLTTLPLVITDVLVLLASVVLCTLIGLQWVNPTNPDPGAPPLLWFQSAALAWVSINAVLGLYPGVCLGLVDEIRRLSLSLTAVAVITLARHDIKAEWFEERLLFIAVAYALCVFMAPVARSILRKTLAKSAWWGFPTLVCGDDSAAFNVDQWMWDNRRLGLRPVGVVANPEILELDRDTARYVGAWPEARQLAEQHHAFWAVLVEPEQTDQVQLGMSAAIEQHLGNVPHIFLVSKLTGMPDHWNRHQMDEGLAGIAVEQHLMLPIPQLVKRGMDLVIAIVVAILLAPLFLALGIATKLNSPGPVFYGHTRVGRGNTRFKAWKFRTMANNAEHLLEPYLAQHPELREEWERDHKLKNDPRVTSLGRWMRKWSIDELPQIWNVLTGDMSIVGPRPIVDAEIAKYGIHFEAFNSVLPGITGLWQVCGRNDTTYEERIQLDMYYVHHWSPWLDLYLLGRTVKTVLFTKGAY
jgi:Undecaprenyl-phosphate galactose phosphotransferase WbaP